MFPLFQSNIKRAHSWCVGDRKVQAVCLVKDIWGRRGGKVESRELRSHLCLQLRVRLGREDLVGTSEERRNLGIIAEGKEEWLETRTKTND